MLKSFTWNIESSYVLTFKKFPFPEKTSKTNFEFRFVKRLANRQ
jgi:hypothetical protein